MRIAHRIARQRRYGNALKTNKFPRRSRTRRQSSLFHVAIDFSSVSKMLASEIFAITISKTKLLITRNHTD